MEAAAGSPGPAAGVSWAAFEVAAPELAAFVQARLDGHRHRLMATLRADGSPRISGTELLIQAGELWIGGLSGSRKFVDLRRDPRIAVHSGSDDPPAWVGDARVSGTAQFVDDEPGKAAFKSAWEAAMGSFPEGPFELIRVAIREVVTVREAASHDHLLVTSWRPGEGAREQERW